MNLSNLRPAEGSVKSEGKRVGRGQGSGKGGTATRGHKGAKSRSGYSRKVGFEGGQMPLQRRVPKFGFTNINRKDYQGINLDTLQHAGSFIGNLILPFPLLITLLINAEYSVVICLSSKDKKLTKPITSS